MHCTLRIMNPMHCAPYGPNELFTHLHSERWLAVQCTMYLMHYASHALCTHLHTERWLPDSPHPIPNSKFHPITVLKTRMHSSRHTACFSGCLYHRECLPLTLHHTTSSPLLYHTPPPYHTSLRIAPRGQTNTCENITLPQTLFGVVISLTYHQSPKASPPPCLQILCTLRSMN